MPLEKDDAVVIIQTLLAFLKIEPEPQLQQILQTYSMYQARLKEHKESARQVMQNRNQP